MCISLDRVYILLSTFFTKFCISQIKWPHYHSDITNAMYTNRKFIVMRMQDFAYTTNASILLIVYRCTVHRTCWSECDGNNNARRPLSRRLNSATRSLTELPFCTSLRWCGRAGISDTEKSRREFWWRVEVAVAWFNSHPCPTFLSHRWDVMIWEIVLRYAISPT